MTNGYCTSCEKRCHWSVHKNQSFYYEFRIETQRKTAAELKAKYQDAPTKAVSTKTLLANAQQQYDDIRQQLKQNVEAVRRYVNRLGEIAARANPLSSVEYIDLLVQGEESEKRPGWQDRRKRLLEVRGFAETGQGIAKPGDYTPTQWQIVSESKYLSEARCLFSSVDMNITY
jgi:hypothetical protein